MPKNTKRIPPALKYGIYSGIGLLPTESRAKFRKFKKQLFAELNPIGRLEKDIGDEIVRWEWRRQHLATYELAERARARCKSIRSEIPQVRYLPDMPSLPTIEFLPDPENPSPQQLRAAQQRADKKIQVELGAALELVELGDVATLEYLEKQVAVRDRLDAMIARLYKKLAYVRAIKSMAPPSLPPPSPPLLERTHKIGDSFECKLHSSFILVSESRAAQRLDLKIRPARRLFCEIRSLHIRTWQIRTLHPKVAISTNWNCSVSKLRS